MLQLGSEISMHVRDVAPVEENECLKRDGFSEEEH